MDNRLRISIYSPGARKYEWRNIRHGLRAILTDKNKRLYIDFLSGNQYIIPDPKFLIYLLNVLFKITAVHVSGSQLIGDNNVYTVTEEEFCFIELSKTEPDTTYHFNSIDGELVTLENIDKSCF